MGHQWEEATCFEPKICSICYETEGTPKEHTPGTLTCTESQYCTVCREMLVMAQGHTWKKVNCSERKCSVCNETQAHNSHDWNDQRTACTACGISYCEVYSHSYTYNRCRRCDAFDEQSLTKAKQTLGNILNKSMTAYDQVKAIHDYLANHISYDYGGYYSGNIPTSSYTALGALTTGKAVCNGYALAFQLLCDAAEIDCEFVTGKADNGSGTGYQGHAWNQVEVNGKWYNIDVTWDDPLNTTLGKEVLRYDYFLISDSQMYRDHIADNAKHVCTASFF